MQSSQRQLCESFTCDRDSTAPSLSTQVCGRALQERFPTDHDGLLPPGTSSSQRLPCGARCLGNTKHAIELPPAAGAAEPPELVHREHPERPESSEPRSVWQLPHSEDWSDPCFLHPGALVKVCAYWGLPDRPNSLWFMACFGFALPRWF